MLLDADEDVCHARVRHTWTTRALFEGMIATGAHAMQCLQWLFPWLHLLHGCLSYLLRRPVSYPEGGADSFM